MRVDTRGFRRTVFHKQYVTAQYEHITRVSAWVNKVSWVSVLFLYKTKYIIRVHAGDTRLSPDVGEDTVHKTGVAYALPIR